MLLTCIATITITVFLIKITLEIFYPPSRLKRRPRRKVFDSTRRIAHRGSRIEFPENTIEAFRFALEHQADMIELDVWYTKDKKIVVFHDGDLRRCTGEDGHANDLNFNELPPLKLPTRDTWLQGSHRRDTKTKIYRIPLLKDVLMLLKEKNVLVEIKETKDSKRIVREVYGMLKKYDLLDRTIWFSLKHKTNNTIRSFQHTISKPIPILPSVLDVLRVLILWYSGLLRYFDIPFDVFGVVVISPSPSHLPFHDKISFIPKSLYRILLGFIFGGGGVVGDGLMYSSNLCQHLHNRGIPTVVLGVNADNAQEIKHPKQLSSSSRALRIARKLGMSACLSDSPAWLFEHTRDDEFR